ncbi:MAG: hypothetical protein A2600_07195 [Candidatus Lambdaproteobacteria bacterium RIFOXYD1_FULL_56_27]|uniref:Nucleoside phosphorylase domain-containing protein n=1 Tax=Candidatus Lambdaproteobacteria bacterium RIFOXYD2_FULL_56_26 TaxID=1817773 RepID=A0A1F6GQ72_9PROT|nr:MAG: hypothetical protein A2557_05855 [Candidatus Lambdaproteobacteria bacterium RIFOXYD2_FULL_56_26]OGH03717.1 MAG: hypothetical protein A2426_00645 [Candidatus Lambdaproteobacteria bacterium RIFOXYC1_FULL_56_13]OGH07301.1 MAG: hypothetical protein A2600_07195 [Candidatus Lambdaproteobacteria bacterium RIFOXYD1_FULL_56_27]
MTLLIASAVAAELEPLALTLRAQAFEGGWRCPGLVLAPLGIGALNAAVGLGRWSGEVAEVIFAGSAGIFPEAGFQIGQVVEVSEVGWAEGAVALGLAHSPLMDRNRTLVAGPRTFGCPKAKVANTGAVTQDLGLAQALARSSGAELETLELYGLALAASKAGLPWSALLGLTNQVGPLGQEQWKANYKNLAQAVGEVLARAWSRI